MTSSEKKKSFPYCPDPGSTWKLAPTVGHRRCLFLSGRVQWWQGVCRWLRTTFWNCCDSMAQHPNNIFEMEMGSDHCNNNITGCRVQHHHVLAMNEHKKGCWHIGSSTQNVHDWIGSYSVQDQQGSKPWQGVASGSWPLQSPKGWKGLSRFEHDQNQWW